jgi:CDGSH-type Zn-finger protein/ferredoxin
MMPTMAAEITPTPDGPLQARDIKALKDDQGKTINTDAEIWLCRCGHSKNKPYCDGSHEAAHFSGKRQRAGGGPKEFVGKEITVVDDFSLCAHAGECVDRAARTFFTKDPDGRVSQPDASPSEQVIAAIRHCPSGALLYKLRGQLVDAYAGDTEVRVEKDGPLHVKKAKLAGEHRPATEDHYTLCRCGTSLNKPFCDGMHVKIKFRDGSA